MERLTIHDKGQPIYPIVLSDNFESLSKEMRKLHSEEKKICIVTDSTVGELYLEMIQKILSDCCVKVTSFTFPAGEESKTLATVENLYEHLILEKFERRDLLVALGGGVVGDLTGFTAATYLRGIDFVQIPTSLLAQVDSSIGGKTGVDFRAYKNMVGAFHQPKLVYANVTVLRTLTKKQYISGLGEIIKHGLIKDQSYYQWLKQHREEILDLNIDTVLQMVKRSCQIKQTVVENDPQEAGERALLNFGHTLGHAVEKLMNFSMLHGECVAVGMHAAAWISRESGSLSDEDFADIMQTIHLFELPVSINGLQKETIVSISKSDKKMDRGNIKFILLHGIGEAFIDRTVTDEMLLRASDCITSDVSMV